jgi:hypothetical protein
MGRGAGGGHQLTAFLSDCHGFPEMGMIAMAAVCCGLVANQEFCRSASFRIPIINVRASSGLFANSIAA